MIAERSVADLLAGIASTEPSPGAGVAGAIALALGVACARKAVRLTLVHRPDDAVLAAADDRLIAIGRAACAGADEDSLDFSELIADLKLPHEDAVERGARDAALRDDARVLVALGERMIALGDALERVLTDVAGLIRAPMVNDILAARALTGAAMAIVRANLAESRART